MCIYVCIPWVDPELEFEYFALARVDMDGMYNIYMYDIHIHTYKYIYIYRVKPNPNRLGLPAPPRNRLDDAGCV